jgi:hypothetical protein
MFGMPDSWGAPCSTWYEILPGDKTLPKKTNVLGLITHPWISAAPPVHGSGLQLILTEI